MRGLEAHRRFWEGTAKRHGWYARPFFVIAWVAPDGSITDSVSYKGLDQDIIVQAF